MAAVGPFTGYTSLKTPHSDPVRVGSPRVITLLDEQAKVLERPILYRLDDILSQRPPAFSPKNFPTHRLLEESLVRRQLAKTGGSDY